ncbi:MAG: ParB/RepB/Spo0J family partition protein [Eubacteriales bacterium]|nr:ParB/RepB/Spo0J family partition protein [Eubacteriales bacterium]
MAKRGLGRGLDSLIPGYDENIVNSSGVVELKIIDVEPNSEQPRTNFDREKLEELAESIRTHGVIQPILVVKDGDRYKIIAGERRWRAAKLAGLKEIPALIRDYDEIKLFEVSLIENLQREDLNPIEEALGYKSLMDRFGMTQEKISERVGKSRSAIANALRLLTLPREVIEMVKDGVISTGHAKVLLSLTSKELQIQGAKYVAEKGLSVRETEKYVKSVQNVKKEKKEENSDLKFYIQSLEDKVSAAIGTKVKIRYGKGKGKIEIQYYTDEDLERILEVLSK